MDEQKLPSNQIGVRSKKGPDMATLFKTLDSTARLTNITFHVIDFFKQKIIYSTSNHTLWEILEDSCYIENSRMSFLSHIIEEDKELLKDARDAYLKLLTKLDNKQKTDTTLVVNYRIGYNDHIYGTAQKFSPLAFKGGKLWLGIVHNTISPYLNQQYATVFNKEIRLIFDPKKHLFIPYQGKRKILTVREHSILTMMTTGLTTEQIAVTLNCTTNTIKTNKKRLFKKLNVKSAHEALAIANTYNLLDL